jgi:hypothetical protein
MKYHEIEIIVADDDEATKAASDFVGVASS